MGAWGTAIFSDDLACDIRDEFRDLIANGMTADEAAESLFGKYRSYLRKVPDDRDVFWLAVAATQWRMGRLLDYVRVQAIDIIDSGSKPQDLGKVR